MCQALAKQPRRRPRARRAARGFTLIEAALTTVIVGTGVLSIVAAQQAYMEKNDWAQRSGMAMLLANELRELTLGMPLHDPITGATTIGPELGENSIADYDDLDDFAGTIDVSGMGSGTVFNPPVNALRMEIPDMDRWSQLIEVESVLPENIGSAIAQPLGTTSVTRVTVTVLYEQIPGQDPLVVTTLSWIVTP